jgi:nucleotide-binding universal stress UspA family protein
MTPRKILVATDFSAPALHALSAGARWARRLEAEVHLVHAYDPSPPAATALFEGSWPVIDVRTHDADCRRNLAELRSTQLEGIARVYLAVLREPSAALAVADYAGRLGVDLIVTGSHGRTGGERLLLGSVAEHIVRHAPCAVLCVRRDANLERFPEKLLVCTDFSPYAEVAVDLASDVASSFDAAVAVAHVYDDRGGRAFGDGTHDLENHLGGAVRRLYGARFKRGMDTAILYGHQPVDAIVECAKKRGTDLIVLSTHGRTGLRRLFIGSVAERVTRHAPCSVLVARAWPSA